MQIRKGLWTTLILLLFLFQNCSKNDHPGAGVPAAQSGMISVDQAKAWAQANLSPKSNARQSGSKFVGTPAWSRKKELLAAGSQGILKIALEQYNVPFGYRDLLFQGQPDGSTRSIIQQVRADSAYLVTRISADPKTAHGVRYYISNADFSGDVIYFDPTNNQFLYGWRYQNGQAKFRLKQKVAQSFARSGGDPKDDDESGGDDGGGGGENPGWTGTGNNTDGYTIDGPEITAPAPPNHNPPPYIPPTTDPGTVNPPTIPVGGGNQPGGNGGVKNDPKADENYEDPKVEAEAIPCPTSFNYVKQGNWQSAVIIGYYFQFLETGSGKMFDVQIGTMETGLPAIGYDGSLIHAGDAQAMSTQAARNAEHMVAMVIAANVLANPRLTPDQVRNNPRYLTLFKEAYAEELNAFLRSDYGYRFDAHPVTVSTSQASFSLKDATKWAKLKFFGRDC